MIKLLVNNIEIPLAKTAIRNEYVNNLFNDDHIQGDYTFPFDIPETDLVNIAFGYASQIDLKERKTSFENVSLLFGNNQMYRGVLEIQSYSNKVYSTSFKSGLTGAEFINKSLKSFDYGGIITPSTSMAQYAKDTSAHNNWNIFPVCFPPHYNPNFYGDANTDFQGTINKTDINNENYLVNTTANYYTIVPFPYLIFILNHVCKSAGYALTGNFVSHPDVGKLALYNNFALDRLADFYTAYITKSNYQPLPFDEHIISFLKNDEEDMDDDNVWNNVEYTISQTGLHVIDVFLRFHTGYADFGPVNYDWKINIAGTDYLLGTYAVQVDNPNGRVIEQSYSYSFTAGAGNVGQKIKIKYKLANPGFVGTFTPPTVYPESRILIVNQDTLGVNIYDNKIDIRNHVPDWTVGDLLNELKKAFALQYDINNKSRSLEINFIKNKLSPVPTKDITTKALKHPLITFDNEPKGYAYSYEIPGDDEYCNNNFKTVNENELVGVVTREYLLGIPTLPGKMKFVRSCNKVYVSKISPAGALTWELYTDRCDVFKYGNGSTDIKSKLMPLLMGKHYLYDSSIPGDFYIYMPHVSQAGTSEAFNTGTNEATPRLVFNHGRILYASGKYYTHASSTNYTDDGNKIAEINLWPGGDDGLHENFAKLWLDLLMKKEVIECDFNFDLLDVLGFRQGDCYYFLNQKYLVKTASLETSDSIKPMRLYLVKSS